MVIIAKGFDWNKIRAEYVAGKSQAKLAKKYHVSRNMIARRSSAEGWTAARDEAKAEIQRQVVKKTAEAVADNATLAEQIKRKGLETLDRLFDEFAKITSSEHRDYEGMKLVDIKRLRDLTAAYRDLTEDMPKAENVDTLEKLDAMLAEVKAHATNA